jgi:hypothetical protein
MKVIPNDAAMVAKKLSFTPSPSQTTFKKPKHSTPGNSQSGKSVASVSNISRSSTPAAKGKIGAAKSQKPKVTGATVPKVDSYFLILTFSYFIVYLNLNNDKPFYLPKNVVYDV